MSVQALGVKLILCSLVGAKKPSNSTVILNGANFVKYSLGAGGCFSLSFAGSSAMTSVGADIRESMTSLIICFMINFVF